MPIRHPADPRSPVMSGLFLAIILAFVPTLFTACSSPPVHPIAEELKANDQQTLGQLQAEFQPRPSIQQQLGSLKRSTHRPADAFEQALLEQDYDQAIKTIDAIEADGQLDFDQAYRRALASKQAIIAFWYEKVLGVSCGLEDNRENLREQSQQITGYFETAYQLAPDDAARLRVAGQWQWIMVNALFFDDSELLRAALPAYQGEHTPTAVEPKQTTARYRELRGTIHQCLSTHNQFKDWQPGEIDHAATLLANEYHTLEHLPVSAERFEQIVKGVPDVLVYAMNMRRSDRHKRDTQLIPSSCPRTFRWHLWCGMTSELPSPALRARLDQQVAEALSRWHAMYDTLDPHPQLPLTADDIVGWGLDDYARFKDNPLVPYYKHPYRADQWAQIEQELEEQRAYIPRWYPVGNTRVSKAMGYRSTRFPPDLYENEIRDARNTQLHFSSAASTRIIAKLRQPRPYDRSAMPDARASGWGGSGSNEHGVYLMSVGNTYPIPPYPWKKYDQR